MTKQNDIYYVEKLEGKITVEIAGKTVLTLEASDMVIEGKKIMDSLDFENMKSFKFSISFKKIKEPNPDEIFFNYAWDFFTAFFKGIEDYFEANKDIEKVEIILDDDSDDNAFESETYI